MVVRVNHPGKSGKRKIDAEIRAHINSARKVQGERFADQEFRINGHIPGGLVSSFVKLPEDAQNTLDRAVQKYGLSLRGRDRVMRVAQTIADLKGDKVGAPDVLEALGYRQEIVFGGCGL
jgi:magnesium chelatase family protein